MLDPILFREKINQVRAGMDQRGAKLHDEINFLIELDTERRKVLPLLENARSERKDVGGQIAQAKKEGRSVDDLLKVGQAQGEQIASLEEKLGRIESDRHRLSLTLPNLPHQTVPVGKSAAENVEIRRYGTAKKLDFTPQPHWDLGVDLGIIDLERGTKIARSRFSVLVGAGARLERALIDFMLDLHTGEHGYLEVAPPFLANTDSLMGTGQLPKFQADLFKVADDWDLFLIPTAEVPLANLHRGEILAAADLPLRYTAYTPCFRSEAGSYGSDVRGLIRQHQFDKVELVALTRPDQSYEMLETLTGHAETVLQRLGLPYRTVVLSTGDMGFAASKTYDLEVWLPGQQKYREISSCSNTEAFQARRANIKYRPEGKGKAEHVHTLNGSGLAVGRTLIAIIENYQQADGSVIVPDALRPYVRGLEVIAPA